MKCGTKYATALTGDTVLGIAHNGWWTNELVLAQLQQAIKIFEITHPGMVGVWLFDNSNGHNAFAADALVAHKLHGKPGGKQPKMRSTVYNGVVQHM